MLLRSRVLRVPSPPPILIDETELARLIRFTVALAIPATSNGNDATEWVANLSDTNFSMLLTVTSLQRDVFA